jgi:probable rRNA maturation factor
MSKNLDISNFTKGALPRVPFVELYKEILGAKYELSISFVSTTKMRALSQAYKGDPTHMNVLSFPISKSSGEIVMCPPAIRAEAKSFGETYQKHLIFLVIHGMLHLAGFVHGSKMESAERRIWRKMLQSE